MTETAHPLPPARRSAVNAATISATLMVVLDMTIANVALPHMQAALSATSESVAWVLTSYIIASAVAMPITGWLAARYGRRFLFTGAIAGFTLASALCGFANSLEQMVAARLLQGIFGAFIMPLGQAVVYDVNPPEKIVRTTTIWGMAIMIGPIMGPVVGGYLTDVLDWRWVFFINVPIGIGAAVVMGLSLTTGHRERRPFDFLGFTLLAVMLGSLQLMLDRGTHLDWFGSLEIIIEAGIAAAALWMFIIHTATAEHPIIPLALFQDRNLASSLLPCFVLGGVSMGVAALLAPMLQRLMNYPVYDAGMVVMPRGIGSMLGMIVAGRLAHLVDGRIIAACGLAMMAWSLHMMTQFNLDIGQRPIVISGLIQGMGIGAAMMPMNLLAFSTMESRLHTDGASLYNLTRNLGGAITISIGSALIASNLQKSHLDLGTHVTAITMPFLEGSLVERLGIEAQTVLAMIDMEINRQALMIAYINDFWVLMWASIISLPLVLIMRPAKPGDEAVPIVE